MSDRERDGFATGMQAADDPAVFLTLDVATSTVIAGTPPSIDM